MIRNIDSRSVKLKVSREDFMTFVDKMKSIQESTGHDLIASNYKSDYISGNFHYYGTFPLEVEMKGDEFTTKLIFDCYLNIVQSYLVRKYNTNIDVLTNAVKALKYEEIYDWLDDEDFRKEISLERLDVVFHLLYTHAPFNVSFLEDKFIKDGLSDCIKDTVRIGRTVDTTKWTPSDVIAKLAEETGELARAVQIKNGKLPSKTQEDGEEIRECADVINCAIDAISQVNLDWSPEELLYELLRAMRSKNKKWESVMFKKDES